MPEQISPGEIGLCPHGRLPGICKECLATDEGKNQQTEIRELAKAIGSEKAKELWKSLEDEGKDPKEYIYDMAMVLGAGFREANEHLNKEFRMRLIAAAQMYIEGRVRVICLTGGMGSEKWQHLGALSEVAKKYLVTKFGIPAEDIILENRSDATHGNLALGLREVYKEDIPVGKFAIISTNYHLNRAREMAKAMGIKTDLVPAESQLLHRSPHYRKFVENWLVKAQNAGMEENEVDKLQDEEYWAERRAVFETPLDQEPPHVDVSATIAKTATKLSQAGGETKGIQTDAF